MIVQHYDIHDQGQKKILYYNKTNQLYNLYIIK